LFSDPLSSSTPLVNSIYFNGFLFYSYTYTNTPVEYLFSSPDAKGKVRKDPGMRKKRNSIYS
jgi:hypothetical protein